MQIAQGYLIPRQVKENGLRQGEVVFSPTALHEIIQGYTREAGVRSLERQMGKMCRKIAAKVAAGDGEETIEVDTAEVVQYLGKREIHSDEIIERVEAPGVAVALAVTSSAATLCLSRRPVHRGRKALCSPVSLGM